MRAAQTTCFHEADPALSLARRAGVEALGTMLLVLAASGGGIAASRLLSAAPGALLPVVAIVLAGALVSLIVAFGAVSGGHFNPLITVLQWLARERGGACAAAYVAAQLAGGAIGGRAAAVLWNVAPPAPGGLGWGGTAGELVASAGLMLVVFGCARSGRTSTGPLAVGAWLIAAVIAFPTTSYANPAVVLGALVTAGPLSLGLGSALPYVVGEIGGALLALLLVLVLMPRTGAEA
ncbi:aquaporin [Sphingomonas sp. BK069]|uniref:aquaporin n=1 Tax=Sphingomonas sp. BK069 TaxID=2586979 RepID=UPI00161AE1DA|nr:aquaporin [Sphingomonas sp. BK069]MBB3348369.1 glycerol uptake facilitator-like aquaporin [Sphingomonas sp. BK069]